MSQKVVKIKILEKSEYKLNYPKLKKIKDKELFRNELYRKYKSVYLYKIQNILISKNGEPAFSNKKLIFDYLRTNSLSGFKTIKQIILILLFYLKKIKIYFASYLVVDNGIIITDRHSSNYYHWVTDVLPKVYLINKRYDLNKFTILIPKFKSSFQKDSIRMITKNFKVIKKNIFLKKCYYISQLNISGCPRPDLIQKVKKKLLLNNKGKQATQKIYISRKYSKHRRLNNENKIIKFLKSENFKIVYPEKLSFIKQIKIFSKANFLISTHGAGLTNLIWMKPYSKILEIRSFNKYQNSNFALSNLFKINYHYFLTKQKNYNSNGNYSLNYFKFKKFYKEVKMN